MSSLHGETSRNLWKRNRELSKPLKFLSDELGKRLERARLDLTPIRGGYVSPDALALEIGGVTGQTLRNYETGETEPDLEMIERLAAVLRVAPGAIAFGSETAMVIAEEPYPLMKPKVPLRDRDKLTGSKAEKRRGA